MSYNSRLFSLEELKKGERLMSPNKRYKLEFLDDGNLVFYDNGKEQWSTRTDKKNGEKCVMQFDGNFVILNANNIAVWATGTNGNKGSYLAIQNDGKLLIYKPKNIKNVLKISPVK